MNLADLFTLAALTQAANTLPVPPSKLGDSGLFKVKQVTTTFAVIESIDGKLVLVPNTNRNDDPGYKKNPKAKRRVFEIPHLPKSATITPTELTVAAFGDSDQGKEQAKVINDKIQGLKNDIEATKEFHRIGAIQGKIMDADGTTVIYDLFQEFGVTEQTVDFELDDDTTDVRAKCLDVKRKVESVLGQSVIKAWPVYCSASFMDQLTRHPNVKEAFKGYQEGADRLAGDKRAGFEFGGLVFIEYEVTVTSSADQPIKFIADNTARVAPDADDLYQTILAPANYNETVNTLGQPIYVKAEERKMGKGWDLEAQSNPLQICTAPAAAVKLIA